MQEDGNNQTQVNNLDLKKSLSNRHIQLIAIGGAIGSGLFMGSGQMIKASGTSIILTYMIVGFVLYFVMRAMGELLLSNSGYRNFADFSSEYLGNWSAYFIGWSYWAGWLIPCILDVILAGSYLQYWFPDVPIWLSAFIFLFILFLLNIATVKLFGEIEFWFSIIKVIAILIFIIVGLWMCFTGFVSPNGVSASFSHLVTPNTFIPNGVSGFLVGFSIALFAFNGIELVGIVAAEAKNPEKTLPKAINSIPVRVLIFYVLSMVVIISVTSFDKISSTESPFVRLFDLAGFPAAAALINFVVLTSTLSAANSGVFATSRTLFVLSAEGNASKFFSKLSKYQVPLRSLVISSSCMLIGLTLIHFQPDIMKLFTLFATLAAVVMIFIRILILISYLVYRRKKPELHDSSIFKMPAGIVMSILCLGFFFAILIVMAFQPETQTAIFITPLWLLCLLCFYKLRRK